MIRVYEGRLVYAQEATTVVDDENQEEMDIVFDLAEHDGKRVKITVEVEE